MMKETEPTESTTEKGNKLEDKLFDYLTGQLDDGVLVYDAYPPSHCLILKKHKYYCCDREADVEFDVVVEVRRTGRDIPHLYVVFECKNHDRPIEDSYVRNFSDQIRSVFGQSVKGILVTSNRLQSGAERVAANRHLGIVKFDENGIDVIVDRTAGAWAEKSFITKQFLEGSRRSKSLRFSACLDEKFFSSFGQMLRSLEPVSTIESEARHQQNSNSVVFLSDIEIKAAAQKAHSQVHYLDGEVDLERLCNELHLDLRYSERELQDAEGHTILGTANFTRRTIEVYQHGNPNRERFTIAHEIGHFCLGHELYLRSEQTVEHDLFSEAVSESTLNYARLEFQANLFASELLLPDKAFWLELDNIRNKLQVRDKGFGYIFVDNQPCNYTPYIQILSSLSKHFGVSKRAIEVKLKRVGLVTDVRNTNASSFLSLDR